MFQRCVSFQSRKLITLYKLDTVWKAEPLVLFAPKYNIYLLGGFIGKIQKSECPVV